MRWWKESLHYLYNNNEEEETTTTNSAARNNAMNNPTIRSLHHVIYTQKLTKSLLDTIINTRMDDLQQQQNNNDGSRNGSGDNFKTCNDMIDFYSKTLSSLLFLHLECCGISLFDDNNTNDDNDEINMNSKENEQIKQVVNCIGIGIGCINSIRSINTGQIGIPNDLIVKYNINTNDIIDPRSIIDKENNKNNMKEHHEGKIAIQNAVKEMAFIAKKYLYYARLHQSIIPNGGNNGDAKICLLSVVSALRYLEKLEQLDYNIFHESLREIENVESLNGRLWRLGGMFYMWRAWLTGIF